MSFSTGDRNIGQILKTKWWQYLLMGLADVEANYTVVKAYQFTTLTSIQVREKRNCCLNVNFSLKLVFFKREKSAGFTSSDVIISSVSATVNIFEHICTRSTRPGWRMLRLEF